MYLQHFGLRDRPFTVTPDPRFFFATPATWEVYASLLHGLRDRKGFLLLTGEVGTGKTLLLRRVVAQLEHGAATEGRVRTVLVHDPGTSFDELIGVLCDELGLPAAGTTAARVRALNEHLVATLAEGGTLALLIDEAQHLSAETLERLRLLSNLETDREKLLQIVLCGQPELEAVLDHPRLRQLRQRIAVRCRLRRLPASDVPTYVAHRIRIAGGSSRRLFGRRPLRLVAAYSAGLPRLVNVLCDAALLIAYALGRSAVSAADVREAARDLALRRGRRPAPSSRRLDDLRDTALRRRTRWRRLAWTAAGLGAAAVLAVPLTRWGQRDDWSAALSVPATRLAGVMADPAALLNRLGLSDVIARRSGIRPVESASPAPTPAAAPTVLLDARPPLEPSPPAEATSGPAPRPSVRLHVVQAGTSLERIAAELYEPGQEELALDLLHEANPQIADVDRIVAGDVMRVPSLAFEGRHRLAGDGSHRVVLAARPTEHEARRLAEAAERRGLRAVVVTRRLGARLTVHRVELVALADAAGATHAWNTAVAERLARSRAD
jgi:general secretion pathway protein A